MVQQYTNEFIESTLDELKEHLPYIHFVYSKKELEIQINKILNGHD